MIDTSVYMHTIQTTTTHIDSSIYMKMDKEIGMMSPTDRDTLKIPEPIIRDPKEVRPDTHLYVNQEEAEKRVEGKKSVWPMLEAVKDGEEAFYQKLIDNLKQAEENFKNGK